MASAADLKAKVEKEKETLQQDQPGQDMDYYLVKAAKQKANIKGKKLYNYIFVTFMEVYQDH